ncbi:MAG: hypothetical protein JNJ55_02200 [Betaproteobacteria bacterium]|nr:hypothetical protein [Betaproteobacteria bacterium]
MSTATDPPVNPQRRDQSSYKGLLVWMILGGVAGYFGAMLGKPLLPQWLPTMGLSRTDLVGVLVAFPFVYLLTIAVHEFGHLAAALASGFQFRVLTIGPFSLVSTADGLQCRTAWSAMRVIGGQQISAPPPGGASNGRYLLYLAGGGLANIAMALLLLLAAFAWTLPPMVLGICLLFAGMNLLLGPMNLLPLSTQHGVRTDGHNMRTLLRGGEPAMRFRALFELIGHTFTGVRPRTWRDGLLRELLLGEPNALESAIAHLMALQVAFDRSEPEAIRAACEHLRPAYAEVPLALRGQFAAELATAYALFLDDAAEAALFGADVTAKSYLISPATVERGRAVVAWSHGRHAECAAAIARGRAALLRSTTELDRVMEAHWFDVIERTMVARSVALPADTKL